MRPLFEICHKAFFNGRNRRLIHFLSNQAKKNKSVSGNMPEKKWVDRSRFFFFFFFFFFFKGSLTM